jgi:glycosyltransferase involved in cell wall biosynthesis
MASGLPAVVTAEGGPKFIVQDGVTGFVGAAEAEMTQAVLRLLEDRELYGRMKQAARVYALSKSWDAVFDSVYEAYGKAIKTAASA